MDPFDLIENIVKAIKKRWGKDGAEMLLAFTYSPKMSEKHLRRYADEFAGRHNIKQLDTMNQIAFIAGKFVGKKLPYKELITALEEGR